MDLDLFDDAHAAKRRVSDFRIAARCWLRGLLRCLCCGGTDDGVALEDSRTMYVLADGTDDAARNAPIALCRGCAADHHAYWDDMWATYRGGLL